MANLKVWLIYFLSNSAVNSFSTRTLPLSHGLPQSPLTYTPFPSWLFSTPTTLPPPDCLLKWNLKIIWPCPLLLLSGVKPTCFSVTLHGLPPPTQYHIKHRSFILLAIQGTHPKHTQRCFLGSSFCTNVTCIQEDSTPLYPLRKLDPRIIQNYILSLPSDISTSIPPS